MSWIVDNSLSFFQRFCVNVLKCGPVPQHVAFIMDGNRRFATKTHVTKFDGHSKGFDKLAECLQWCLELGIKEVTVYAFSIENFHRSPEEVETLMGLATEKFAKLLEEKDKLMRDGVCIRVVGNLALLPVELRKLLAKAMLLTRHNNKAILNVAFAYTSRDEISNAVKTISEGIRNKELEADDVNESLISQCLYTNLSINPEVLVRTSGEVRLSDYLLWQISNTHISFRKVLWPEFSIWHLLACIFKYQRCYSDMQNYQIHYKQRGRDNCKVDSLRVVNFLDNLQEKRFSQLECYASA